MEGDGQMIEGLSIGLLSWKAHETLRRTLESYARARLAANAAEFKVFFNEISDADRALAAEFGVECCGDRRNLGIWGGMDACAKALSGDVVLLLQNDCPVVASPEETTRYLEEGVRLIRDGKADMIRLRHRFNQGDGISFRRFYGYWPVHEVDPRAAKYFDPQLPPDAGRDTLRRRLLRLVRPFGARRRVIAAIHLEAHPEQVYPQWISREGDYFLVDSEIVNFSEQPLLISKSLYLSLSDWCRAHPRHRRINGAPVMEHALNSRWWRGRHFKVGFCDEGVFTHNRFDDSWRPEHAAFNAAISEEKR